MNCWGTTRVLTSSRAHKFPQAVGSLRSKSEVRRTCGEGFLFLEFSILVKEEGRKTEESKRIEGGGEWRRMEENGGRREGRNICHSETAPTA